MISLTTIPTRLPLIRSCIDSLMHQTVRVPIYVWIPKEFKRKGVKFDGNVPDFLKQPGIYVEVVEDLGSISKLYYALDLNGRVITVDDDVIYDARMVETLMAQDQGAYCLRGRTFIKAKDYGKTALHRCHEIKKQTEVDIITGTWGACYDTSYFKKEELVTTHEMVDDIVISGVLRKKNIPMYCLPLYRPMIPHATHAIDSLWEHNMNHRNNNKAINELF